MSDYSEAEVVRVLNETASVIDSASTLCRQLVTEKAASIGKTQELVDTLSGVIGNLSPEEIAGSRKTPWITRSQAAEILTACRQMKGSFDISALVKTAGDLIVQAKAFLDIWERIASIRTDDEKRESDWDHLSADQALQVLAWIEENKAGKR